MSCADDKRFEELGVSGAPDQGNGNEENWMCIGVPLTFRW